MVKDRVISIIRAHDPVFAPFKKDRFEEIGNYLNTREEKYLPPLPAAANPTWFRFKRLTRTQLRKFVELAPTENEQMDRAFMAGIIEVEGPLVGGVKWRPSGLGDPNYQHMQDAEVEQYFAPLDTGDIGSWIYAMSTAPLDFAPRLPVQLMCLRVLDGLVLRSAEQSRDAAAQTSSPPKVG
jgi:hypothetical protein